MTLSRLPASIDDKLSNVDVVEESQGSVMPCLGDESKDVADKDMMHLLLRWPLLLFWLLYCI